MVRGLYVERGRTCEVLDASNFSHDPQPCILFIGLEGGSFFKMYEIWVMPVATSLALLSNRREHIVDLRKSFVTRV